MSSKTGEHIRIARMAKGYTQDELAEVLGVSFQAVSSWERGIYLPDTEKLIDLSKALGVSIDLLLNDKPFVGKHWVLHDRMFDERHMRAQVFHGAHSLGFVDTLKALDFATEQHRFMTRQGKDHVPYIYHPLLMACQALALGLYEDEIIAACLLHDTVEDCGVSLADLPVSAPTRAAVQALTKQNGQDFGDYIMTLQQNRIASIVKILDRCCNISTMATGFSEEKMAEYIGETEQYILPLIDEVRKQHPEFYDACFICKYQMLSVISTVKHIIK